MSERDLNEAAVDESQESLTRISRRRFIRMAALSGVASASVLGMRKGLAQSSHVQVSPDYLRRLFFEGHRCQNTRNLVLDNTVNEVFRTKSLGQLLTEGKNKIKIKKVPALQGLIQDVINNISGDDPPLREYFMDDLISRNPGLSKALLDAKPSFAIPFINADFDRVIARELLHDDVGAPFLQAFGNHYLGNFLGKTRNRIGAKDEKILGRAHYAGFFRSMSVEEAQEIFKDGADQCAKQINGVWRCVNSNGDKCHIVDGFPTASTDICP